MFAIKKRAISKLNQEIDRRSTLDNCGFDNCKQCTLGRLHFRELFTVVCYPKRTKSYLN